MTSAIPFKQHFQLSVTFFIASPVSATSMSCPSSIHIPLWTQTVKRTKWDADSCWWLSNFQNVVLSEGSLQCYHRILFRAIWINSKISHPISLGSTSALQFPSASRSSSVVYSLQDFRIKFSTIIFFAVRATSLVHPVLLDFISLLLIQSLLTLWRLTTTIVVVPHR